MRNKTRLFSKYDLSRGLEAKRESVRKAADSISAGDLRSNFEALANRLTTEHSVQRIELRQAEITVENTEASIDVSRDQNRMIFDRSQPFYLQGTRVSYFVPFSGETELVLCQPNSYTLNPPRARVEPRELIFEYDVVGTDVAATKADFQRDLGNVQQYVGWVNEMVDAYNQQVPSLVRQSLSARLARLQEAEKQVSELGFPVRQGVSERPPGNSVASEVNAGTRGSRSRRPAVEYDVALSFAGENRDYVEQVATQLRNRGVRVFYDRFEEISLWGKNLVDHVAEVYGTKSRFVVIFVSAHYAAKAWPTLERQHAQAKAMRTTGVVVLPARFDDTPIPGLADTVAYLDLRVLQPEETAARIVEKLAIEKD